MTPIVFINCKDQIFVDMIISGQKMFETRSIDSLKDLTYLNGRVLIAETGRGKPVVRCSALLVPAVVCRTRKDWDEYYRELACIEPGSRYDWKPETEMKYCYQIVDAHPVKPFIPPEGKRHGRVWMEYEEE